MESVMKTIVVVVGLAALVGCASQKVQLSAPASYDSNTKRVVQKSFDEAWKEMVSGLSKSFFVINNIEKESGIVNVSFSADDPSQFIDCGNVTVTIGNESRTIDAAKDAQFPWTYHQGIYTFVGSDHRDVSLNGRVNIYLEEHGENATEIDANTKYVVNATEQFYGNGGQPLNQITTNTTFQTGTSGSMQNIVCRSNGRLEQRILAFVK